MLAYEVMIWRAEDVGKDHPWEWCVARWLTGAMGLRWIQELTKEGLVRGWKGNGYPFSFEIQVGTLLERLRDGLPANATPAIFGDDYVLPAGFNGELHLDVERLNQCQSEEWLACNAWDQS